MTSDGKAINEATGGVTEAPAATPANTPAHPAIPDIASLLSEIDKNLQPSQEEQDVANKIANIESGANLNITAEANRPIALPFITGRQKAVEARSLALTQPLQTQAALLQAKRLAALDASKTKLSAMVPLYKPKEEPAKTASVQEYEYAKSQGYKGTFSQYQNEDANRKAVATGAGGGFATGTPNSYKEWQLAGSPGTYNEWLQNANVKAPTVAQQTVATYAARLEQANPTIDNLTKAISTLNPVKFEAYRKLPSYLQSADYQQFDQAARNFINAVLRRESGAVISPSEFDNAYKQYLPRPNDTKAVLDQKKQNRDIVFASLKKAAGNAFTSVNDLLGGGGSAPVAGGGTSDPLGLF